MEETKTLEATELVDFGDRKEDYKDLDYRDMDIPLIIDKNSIKSYNTDSKTAEVIGFTTQKNEKLDLSKLVNRLLFYLLDFKNRKVSLLIENITIKDQENPNYGYWRIRIRPDSPTYNKYLYNGKTIIIECFRKQGRLKVSKIYLQAVSDRPYPTEGLVRGHLYLLQNEDDSRIDVYLKEDDFKWLLDLQPRRRNLAERLKDWEDYLKIHLTAVKNKQAWVQYDSLVRVGPSTARVRISTKNHSDNIDKTFFGEEEIGILDYEVPDNKNWRPDEDTPEPIFIGTLPSITKIKKYLTENYKNISKNEWEYIEIELDDRYVISEDEKSIKLNKNTSRRDPLDKLPEAGILVNSIFADELPLKLQQRAIKRLKEGTSSNPRLEDFVFDITEVRSPLRNDSIFKENLVQSKLNEYQLKALETAINSPDISLIQGPPGTGKTTVIAELCYQTVLRGGKVLLASQSNLAVDNALSRLTNKSEIMPIRIGKRTTEEGEEFVEENVVSRWFKAVKENVEQKVFENQQFVEAFQKYEAAINVLEQTSIIWKKEIEKLNLKQTERSLVENKIHEFIENNTKSNIEFSLISEKIILINKIKRQDEYTAPENFESIAFILPEVVDELSHEFKNLFYESGFESKYSFNQNDICEVIPNIKKLKDSNQSIQDYLNNLLSIIQKLDLINNSEIKELEQKHTELILKMSKVTDMEQMGRMSLDLVEINQKIDNIKKQNNEIALGNQWKDEIVKLSTKLRPLLDLLNLIQSESLQNSLIEIQSSFQPKKEYVEKIKDLTRFLNILNTFSLKVPAKYLDKISAKYQEYENTSYLIKQKIDQNNQQLLFLSDSKEVIDVEIDSISELIKNYEDIINSNKKIVSKIGFLSKIDNNELNDDLLSNLKLSLKKREQENREKLDQSKRWLKLQKEWVEKINTSSKEEYTSLKNIYINLANVVGATCTETGKKNFWGQKGRVFDLVIIDEVSKATPPELLMPMLLGKQIVLVGDHQQLPPIFKLNEEEIPLSENEDDNTYHEIKEKYEKLVTSSYFQEMFENANDSIKSRLITQYRMHPTIMNAINQFYPDGYKLECGIQDPEEARKNDYFLKGKEKQNLTSANSHLIWVDTGLKIDNEKLINNIEDREVEKYKSRYNLFEVETIEKILKSINKQVMQQNGSEMKVQEVSIISFYAGQVRKLKDIRNKLNQSGDIKHLKLKIGTVDRFQGMESPIVIVSLVSSPSPKERGPTKFVKEFRRINVAFSRAQSLLIIVGSERTFSKVDVEINYDGNKEIRRSYGEILRATRNASCGNYFVKGYEIYEE